jgi:hypothetical protein
MYATAKQNITAALLPKAIPAIAPASSPPFRLAFPVSVVPVDQGEPEVSYGPVLEVADIAFVDNVFWGVELGMGGVSTTIDQTTAIGFERPVL